MKLVEDPNSASQILKALGDIKPIAYAWFAIIAIWGGTSSYLSRIKKHKIPFSISELIGEWVISGFSGIITAYICLALKWDVFYIFAAAGIAGHAGGRAIGMMENLLASRLGVTIKPEDDQP